MVVGTASNKLFRALCSAIGRSELAGDDRYRSHRGRARHREEINAIVAEWVRPQTCEQVLETLGPGGADLPCARVARPERLVDDPQLLSRDMIERHAHPSLGEVIFHGNPLRFSQAEPRERALAPDLAAHNREIFAEIGIDESELERLSEAGVI